MKALFVMAIACVFLSSNSSFANDFDDGFGERFYNQTPVGMADYAMAENETYGIAMDEMAKDLQEIMPAAGAEIEIIEEAETQLQNK